MDTRLLRYFVAIVDNGGVTRAAESLGVTQPTLSHAMRMLERACGAPLFHYTGRRVVLSAAGEELLGPARQVLQDIEAAQAAVDALRGLETGTVSVACPPFFSDSLVRMIAAFRQRHPGVKIAVDPSNSSVDAIESVRSARCELGLTDGRREDLRAYVIGHDELYLAAPPGSAFSNGGTVRLRDLHGVEFISGLPGTKPRALLDAAVADGIGIDVVVQTPHRRAVVPLIARGVGCGFVLTGSARQAAELGAHILQLDPPVPLDVLLVHRHAALTPAAEAFVRLALAIYAAEPAKEGRRSKPATAPTRATSAQSVR